MLCAFEALEQRLWTKNYRLEVFAFTV
jgi:hypothetical protein